jgi:hypothetical protein
MKKDKIKKILAFTITLCFLTLSIAPTIDSQFENSIHNLTIQKDQVKYLSDSNSVPWWHKGWEYRKKITIDHSKVVNNLVNFPVLISLDSDYNLAQKAQDNGNDIVFIDASGAKLNHEIELFNGSTGELISWVNVTKLSSTEDTILYMYYGNETYKGWYLQLKIVS